jgi:hypothetical protein
MINRTDSQICEAKCGHESRGTRNQEWLCWRGSAAAYQTNHRTVSLGYLNRCTTTIDFSEHGGYYMYHLL